MASFKRGVVQHLEGRRRALIQATLGGTRPNSIEVMSLLSAAKRLSRRWAASVVDLCSLVVELWLHLRIEDTYNDDSFNFSFIEAEVNSALESDATHVAANVAVCVHAVERGLAGQTKNSLQVCWSHWNLLWPWESPVAPGGNQIACGHGSIPPFSLPDKVVQLEPTSGTLSGFCPGGISLGVHFVQGGIPP